VGVKRTYALETPVQYTIATITNRH